MTSTGWGSGRCTGGCGPGGGERPLAVGAHRYRWFYVCTFVEPETGESLSLLVDGMDTEVMSWVLRELRAWLGEGEEAWVVLDRAGWHVSGRVEVPEGVRLVFLPPYSPELQPVERVWPLVERGGGQSGRSGHVRRMLWARVVGRAAPGTCGDPAGPDSEPYPLPLVA